MNEITWASYMGNSGFENDDFNINQGFWLWESESISTYFKDSKHVLVAGAGGGREAIALCKLGYQVTAFDFSSDLTMACRQNLKKAGCFAQVFEAPADQLPEDLGTYDALFIGRGFYHHIPSGDRRVAFLRACRTHLENESAVFISDFFTRSADSRFHKFTFSIAVFFRRLRGAAEPVALGDWLSLSMQHAFTRDELEEELSAGGMCLEAYSTSPFNDGSHLAHAVARAI